MTNLSVGVNQACEKHALDMRYLPLSMKEFCSVCGSADAAGLRHALTHAHAHECTRTSNAGGPHMPKSMWPTPKLGCRCVPLLCSRLQLSVRSGLWRKLLQARLARLCLDVRVRAHVLQPHVTCLSAHVCMHKRARAHAGTSSCAHNTRCMHVCHATCIERVARTRGMDGHTGCALLTARHCRPRCSHSLSSRFMRCRNLSKMADSRSGNRGRSSAQTSHLCMLA